MHPTAMSNGKLFFDTYGSKFDYPKVVELGSQDVNGSLRDVCPTSAEYIGLDFVEGKGVDIVLSDPYKLPLESESVDIVVSSSCFEHSEMFWLSFLEIMRILKPTGLFYLNAPANGAFHRYPVDCWRFYPDSGNALVTWARRSGMKPTLLESYVSIQHDDIWNDFVAVFVKDEAHAGLHPERINNTFKDFENGKMLGTPEVLNMVDMSEDIRRSRALDQQIQALKHCAESLRAELATRNALVDETMARLDAANSRVRSLEESASWRVTAPLRAIKRGLSKAQSRPSSM